MNEVTGKFRKARKEGIEYTKPKQRKSSDKGPAVERMTKEELATFVAGKSALTKIEAMKKTIKQLTAIRDRLLADTSFGGRRVYLGGPKSTLSPPKGDIDQRSAGGVIKRRGGGIAKRGMGIAK